jgi:hypothetical protein
MKIRNKNKKLILAVFVGNLISLPLVWFVVPFLPIEGILLIILSEIFVIILESIIIRFLVAKTTWKEAVLISILLNLISWILGGIILLFILFW